MPELKPLQIWENTWWNSDKGYFVLLSKDKEYWTVGYFYDFGTGCHIMQLTDEEILRCKYVKVIEEGKQ